MLYAVVAVFIVLYFQKVSTQSKMVWGLHKGSGSTLFKISAHNDVITGTHMVCAVNVDRVWLCVYVYVSCLSQASTVLSPQI